MTGNRIASDPKVMLGKPVIKGTRVTVEFILRMLGSGCSTQEMISEYDLTQEDILAALSFAEKKRPASPGRSNGETER